MSRLESPKHIAGIVGTKRHGWRHFGRAVSAEGRVYILHSKDCVASGIDLRECAFSLALDRGIDEADWERWQDQAVELEIEDGILVPLWEATHD